MTAQTRSVNAALFQDGDKPTGSNYADLIDSFLSLADTTAQTITSDIQAPKMIATTEVSSPQINTTEVSASILNADTLNVQRVSASSARLPLIDGPVRVGAVAAERGRLVLTQQTTITRNTSVNTTVAVLPSGSDMLDMFFHVTNVVASAGATGAALRVGVCANETQFGTIVCSGRGQYSMTRPFTSAGTSWLNLTGATRNITAKLTARNSLALASAAQGLLTVVYVQKVG